MADNSSTLLLKEKSDLGRIGEVTSLRTGWTSQWANTLGDQDQVCRGEEFARPDRDERSVNNCVSF